MSFLTYHITDYMLPDNIEAYELFTQIIEMLPNKEQFHFNNPEEKAYMDKLYDSIESFRNRQTLYRLRKLMVLFLGDKLTARMLTQHFSKDDLKQFLHSIDRSHPFGDMFHHIINFIEHNEQFDDKAHRRQEIQPIRAVGTMTPEEETAVASMPFRYNFWATNRAHARTLENIFAKPDFFDRFALHSLGFSFAERDFGERNNYAGWYAPSFHYLNIVPSKGDVKITMFHEYVHAVDFGTKKLREKNATLSKQWDALWDDAYTFLWDRKYSPFAKGYQEPSVRLNFTEPQMMNLVKDFAASKERKDVFRANLPPWYTWLMMDKLRFRKDYYALKEEMIARLGSMLLFVEYGRIQNEAGRVLHLKEELHTSTGIDEKHMEVFQEKAVEWCKKFETYIQECNHIDLSAGQNVSYLNYMPVDLRGFIEAVQPVVLDAEPEIVARYHQLFDAIKGLLQTPHKHITLSHYFHAIKPYVSEETLSKIAKANITRGKIDTRPYLLSGDDPLLYLALNRKEGVNLLSTDKAKQFLSDTFHPLLGFFDKTIAISEKMSADEEVAHLPFFEKNDNGGVDFWSPAKNLPCEDLWSAHFYQQTLSDLVDITDVLKDPKIINDYIKKYNVIQQDISVNVVNAVELCGKKISRTGNLDVKDASFAEVFSLFEGVNNAHVPNTSVEHAMDEFFISKPEYWYDYQVAQGLITPIKANQANSFVLQSAFYGIDFALSILHKTHPDRIVLHAESLTHFADTLVEQLELLKPSVDEWKKELKEWKEAHRYLDSDDEEYDQTGLDNLYQQAKMLLSELEKVSRIKINTAIGVPLPSLISNDLVMS